MPKNFSAQAVNQKAETSEKNKIVPTEQGEEEYHSKDENKKA